MRPVELAEGKRTFPADAKSVLVDPNRTLRAVIYRIAKDSLDHLVGECEQRRRHFNAQCLGGPEIKEEYEARWL